MNKPHSLGRTLAVLAWLPLTSTALQASPAGDEALARRLADRAQASLQRGDLGLARLQFELARERHAPTADAAQVATLIMRAAASEDSWLQRGLAAVAARDLVAVQRSVRALRALDAQSGPALQVVLRYQAALADFGGVFPRVHWQDVQTGRPPMATPAASAGFPTPP